jgi:hypothetical protein
LRELFLDQVQLGDAALFTMLAAQAPCLLTSLIVSNCTIKDTAVEAAAAALARLPSLRACRVGCLGTVPLRIASQLTALTHLDGGLEAGVPFADTQLVKAVSRNKGLQSLTVSSLSVPLSSQMLKRLLDRCSNLTQIDLTSEVINDERLNILLQHGPNITDVRLGGLVLTRSRADSTCKWQRLWLDATETILAGLAYLPLRSVQELGTGGHDWGTLNLPLLPSSQRQVLLLHQAVSNLKACPAWQKQPATRVLLYTYPWGGNAAIPVSQIAQLLSALSPLGGLTCSTWASPSRLTLVSRRCRC